jgi:hypothetical protein
MERDDAWTDWSGTLGTASGVLSLLRTIAFDLEDKVLPPPNAQTIAFESRTRPHFDGLIARLNVDGEPSEVTLSTASGKLSFTPGAEPTSVELPVAGDEDLKVAFLSIPLGDPCAHAVVAGRWRPVDHRECTGGHSEESADAQPRTQENAQAPSLAQREHRRRHKVEQRIRGRVMTPDGKLIGHWRGFSGKDRQGVERVFGKVIDAEGTPVALVRGTVDGEGNLQAELVGEDDSVLGRFGGSVREASGHRRYLLTTAATNACLGAAPSAEPASEPIEPSEAL